MRFTLLILLSLISQNLSAHDSPDCDDRTAVHPIVAAVQNTNSCPNWNKIKHICVYISGQTSDPNPMSPNQTYLYQRKIYEASCVQPSDSEAVKHQKIRDMWASFENQLICDSVQTSGRVTAIKFAADTNFDQFINDVAIWKVNLNQRDPVENNTVLDYLQIQINRNRGNALEGRLQRYYNTLKNAGAKHSIRQQDA